MMWSRSFNICMTVLLLNPSCWSCLNLKCLLSISFELVSSQESIQNLSCAYLRWWWWCYWPGPDHHLRETRHILSKRRSLGRRRDGSDYDNWNWSRNDRRIGVGQTDRRTDSLTDSAYNTASVCVAQKWPFTNCLRRYNRSLAASGITYGRPDGFSVAGQDNTSIRCHRHSRRWNAGWCQPYFQSMSSRSNMLINLYASRTSAGSSGV